MTGFLKDTGGRKRMRYVQPGYDPNNMAVPNNQVIFDSEDIGLLSIWRQGTWTSPDWDGQTQVVVDGLIVSWPTLPYIPLVTMQFRQRSTAAAFSPQWRPALLLDGNNMVQDRFKLHARINGIYMRYFRGSDTPQLFPRQFQMRYQVYRFPT